MKFKKLFLPVLLSSLLLSGCGRGEAMEVDLGKDGDERGDITTIDTLENIKIPVYKKDLASEYTYNPTLLSHEDDAAFFSYLDEGSTTGVASDYSYNSGAYKSPYCFSDDSEVLPDLDYTYISRDSMDYESAVMSNTGKQFEFYKKDDFLYELTSPVTPTREEEIRSLSKAKTVNDFADMLDEIAFIHADKISVTGDLGYEDRENMILKHTKVNVTTYDGSELSGIVAGIEYNDRQYFYLYASKEERDYKDIIHSLTENTSFDIDNLINENNPSKKEITFDINGTAGTINVPSYFRSDEIDDNIYSQALTYIPSKHRSDPSQIKYPEEEGSTEVYLTNEYYNIALTYNNFVIPKDCTTDYEMYVRTLGIPYGQYYDSEILMFGSIDKNNYIIPRQDLTDKDGNVWNSYFIKSGYIPEDNYPDVIPYPNIAVIYTHKLNNSVQIFTLSSGLTEWWNNNAFINSIDSVISSFSSRTPNTKTPDQALSYYRTRKYDVNQEGFIKRATNTFENSTSTDSTLEIHKTGDIDEGPGHREYLESGKMKGTSTGDKEADADGLTQEYIDSLPMLDDEVD